MGAMALVVVDGAGKPDGLSVKSVRHRRYLLPVAGSLLMLVCYQQNRIRDAASAAAPVTVGGSGRSSSHGVEVVPTTITLTPVLPLRAAAANARRQLSPHLATKA